jgi:hypothetical protein
MPHTCKESVVLEARKRRRKVKKNKEGKTGVASRPGLKL